MLAPPEMCYGSVPSSPFRGIRGDLLELHSLAASLSLLLFAHRCCAATSAAKVREVVKI